MIAARLKNIIEEQLSPLIDANYVLLDVPYYSNIGDTLIWEGTRQFLKNKPYKCLYTASVETYKFRPLPPETIILMQGGGNFGDLWRRHQDLRLSVIKSYPNNKIIILPQSIFYKDANIFKEDARIINLHKNLHVCVRDNQSYELVKNEFTCNIHLVPDMAFCIPKTLLAKHSKRESNRVLFLKRDDVELCKYDYLSYIADNKKFVDIHDWPTRERYYKTQKYLDKLLFHRKRLKRIPDIYAEWIFRPFMVRKGIEFISRYKKVYTTRLHVAILSILLNKEVVWFDNSYGKNKSLFETWLKGADKLTFV